MAHDLDSYEFVKEMFAFFGFRGKHEEVMEEQGKKWVDLIEYAFGGEQGLADRYRQEFYRKTVTSPFLLLGEFEKFIVAHPRIREEYFDAELRASGGCEVCDGWGYVCDVPVFRRKHRSMTRIDRHDHDRVRQMLARRALKLWIQLVRFGHADQRSGLISMEALDLLSESAAQGKFIGDYKEVMPQLGGRYTARRCTCLKSIEYGTLEPIEAEVYDFLLQDKAQKKRQFNAMCDYYGVSTKYMTLTEMTSRLKVAIVKVETDARFVDGYFGDYCKTGKIYNDMRRPVENRRGISRSNLSAVPA